MASVDNVQVNSSVDKYGNGYTTNISNDKLTNADFLNLMLQELKMQDPTKPADSSKMLNSQMQMSSIETNLSLVKSMEKLTTAYGQSALSSASTVIGKNVENGAVSESGGSKAYIVRSVLNENGQVILRGQELAYIHHEIKNKDGEIVKYNNLGELVDAEGNKTGNKVALQSAGKPILKEGKPVILDENNEEIVDSGYVMAGSQFNVYKVEMTNIPFSSVTRIF